PPPTLPASGQVTAWAKATATAASTAFPPRRRTSTPTSAAGGETHTTMPDFAPTGPRSGGWAAVVSAKRGNRVARPSTRRQRMAATQVFAAPKGRPVIARGDNPWTRAQHKSGAPTGRPFSRSRVAPLGLHVVVRSVPGVA